MSRRAQRVHDIPGYMLHATAWRETSLIVQAFSREYGCIALVAKGAKRPYSVLRPVLSAFQPLLLSWSGAGEVKTMTRAEIAGVRPLGGPALMSAWYMNELLLRLLPCEDAHPVLYDAYDTALTQLSAGSRAAGALRRFEWILLRETGYGLDEAEPDFNDPAIEPALRRDLRERLEANLAGRPLSTRKVLLELQRL
ncbi:DNA repair protein RecO [Bordetella pertussis]|uniref:DNA repair protein RecO n=3 Tax=Bordetella pertussis TaxID=520 RepID=Q7VW41_BORPE|nr:DNA repair protein RecO [Bordetella pertussis]ETH37617.1 recombination protein O, N-terminal domain protein [Bordetella pertussis H918]ETH45133.1 recombination protein O, N-terminal domain protein [Bordetella pertussis H939]ETH46939.1 recombination protein O, N-terminal domain protein [Bordetella pertussis H921]ETH72234.1 recombination protein O, N-terminal domain protein [Bordetella pertussis STO1-CHLA-0011]ETH82884.1 recombination protein O, N-terminal domain protein [Bordetella pertussis